MTPACKGVLNNMDKIIMCGMSFYGYHGVLPQERELGQIFEVDVELYLDLRAAGENDDPEMTVSYADVYEVVRRVVTGLPRNLIETVAESVASRILNGQFCHMGVEIRRVPEQAGESL